MKKDFYEFKSKYLNPLTDFGFHKIFGTESNKDLLIDFLNQVIKEEGLITDIEYLRPEQFGDLETDRKAIFDIFCITENGNYFIVEMQKAKRAFFRERSIYYASFPIQKQALKGIWNFNFNAVYFVAVLDFILFEEFIEDKKHVVEHVFLMRERTKTVYSNKLKFAFVELPKFNKTEGELETHFDIWLYLLKNLPKLKTQPATVQGDIFKKLFELSEIKQLKKEDMETYRKSVLEYYDVQDAMECARGEGREEGLGIGMEKGIEKEKKAIIKKCFRMDIPIDVIKELTGYSKEQILYYNSLQK